jgi:ribose transport system permease protein
MRVRRRLNLGLDRFSGVYLWAAFIALFAILTPQTFLTSWTAESIATQ